MTYIHTLNELLSVYLVVPILFLVGAFLSWRLRFIQFTSLKGGVKDLLLSEGGAKGSISHFQAISAVLAGNLGTGNISGTAVALAMGGPGSVFWMWVMAALGTVIKYAGCFLGVKYRTQNENGEYVGGPMYYIDRGLGSPKLAVVFCFCAIASAFTVGNLVQVNSVTLPLQAVGIPPVVTGLVLMVAVGVVLIRGLGAFARLASAIVPAMALLYLGASVSILLGYLDQVPQAFALILKSAFSHEAALGGGLGFSVAKAMTVGFERGVFATDAGLGIAPILQSGAKTKDPRTEGVVAMVAPWVVVITCTMTALVLITTGAYQVPGLESTEMCSWAFENGGSHPALRHVITVTLFFFAYTTILAWACCADKAVEYLGKRHRSLWFDYAFIATIPLGALAHVGFVWAIADTAVILMLLTNLIGLIGLSREVVSEEAPAIAS